MELSRIAELTKDSTNKILEAKVYRKWFAKTLPRMTPYAFCCILIDQEGNAIQANMNLKDADYFDQKLHIGMAYRISNFMCESTSTYQQTLQNPTSLRFGKYTSFQNIPATTFPHHYFEFITYNQLESRVPKPDKNNKMQYPILTDYIGCMRSVGSIDNKGDPNRNQSLRRKIDIENLNGNIIELTLWDELAEHIAQADLSTMEQPVIIAVSSCRVSRYRGEYQLAASPATYYYLNPRIPEAEESRPLYKARYEDTPPLIIRKNPFQDATQEKLRNRYPLKTIMEQNPDTYKGIRFTAEATITSINTNKDWYYESCHQCSRKANIQEDKYSCLDHGPQPGPFYRYKFKGYITDMSATAPLTFFTPAADKITGESCMDLLTKYSPSDPSKIPPEVLATEGKSCVFQFHFNTLGNMTDLNLDNVFDVKKQHVSTSSNTQETIQGTPPTSTTPITPTVNKQNQGQEATKQATKRTLFPEPPTSSKKSKMD